MNTGYVNATYSLLLISFIPHIYIPSINRYKENEEKPLKEKIPASTYIALYFRNTFPLNNLISHFHSPGKFLLILWGLTWRVPPPGSSLSIFSSLCVSSPAMLPTHPVCFQSKSIYVFSSWICPITLCSTYVSYVIRSYVLPMCNALSSSKNKNRSRSSPYPFALGPFLV